MNDRSLCSPQSVQDTVKAAIEELSSYRNTQNVIGMQRFGIRTDKALGVSVKHIRQIGKRMGKNTAVALALLEEPYHEAQLLAFVILRAAELSEGQLDAIVRRIDSWDTCDLFCGEIARHPSALRMVLRWTQQEGTFVRRAGFSLAARMAVRCKDLPDEAFQPLLALVEHAGNDPRPMVNKAVDWALRQIGKRSTFLHPYALSLAEKMAASSDRNTRRIGRISMKELSSPRIIARLRPHAVWPEEGVVEMPGYC